MAQIDISKAVTDKLEADQTSGSFYDTLANARRASGEKAIWFVQGDQDENLPMCVLNFVGDVPVRYFPGDDLDMSMQIDLYVDAQNSTPEAAVALNDLLLGVLDKVTLTATNHANVQCWATDRGSPVREEDAYRIMSQWNIRGTIS